MLKFPALDLFFSWGKRMLYYLIKDTGGKKKEKILLLFPGGGKVPIAEGECGLQGEDMGSNCQQNFLLTWQIYPSLQID